MPVVTEIVVDTHVGGLDDAWDRLGNTGVINRAFGDLLDEASRVGEQSAEIYAPEYTRRLKRGIGRAHARVQAGGAVEAAVGVRPVRELAGGRAGPLREGEELYPLYVHEGTGVYGVYRRMIRPRMKRYMRFPGRTGLVFTKTTRGQRPQPYMAEAFDDVVSYVEQRIDSMVRAILGD